MTDTDGPDPHLLEDPAEAWISLVEACRIEDVAIRRSMVNTIILKARKSHWTINMWNRFADGYDSPSDTEPFDQEAADAFEHGTMNADDCADAHALAHSQARTKVTARAQGVYCPFCGQWFTALDFAKHTC